MDYLERVKKGEALAYLANEKVAVLSTHGPDGMIDAMAVYFIADEDLHFYFTTKVGTRKYQNMTTDPRVTLTIPNTETLRTVELQGTVQVIIDPKEVSEYVSSLIQKNTHEGLPWSPPLGKLDAGQYVIMQVTPTWLRYSVFLNEAVKGEYFTQIIPPKAGKNTNT